jgi:hypothetical protein
LICPVDGAGHQIDIKVKRCHFLPFSITSRFLVFLTIPIIENFSSAMESDSFNIMDVDAVINTQPEGIFSRFELWNRVLEFSDPRDICSFTQVRFCDSCLLFPCDHNLYFAFFLLLFAVYLTET